MTANSLKELMSVLLEKSFLLESLRDRLMEEQRRIIEANPENLEATTRDAEECLSRMHSLNGRFAMQLGKVASELGLEENPSLSSIIISVEPEASIHLQKLQDRCFSIADDIASLLKTNEALLKNSLDIIGRSLSFFSSLLGGADTYGATGRLYHKKTTAGIFCREI